MYQSNNTIALSPTALRCGSYGALRDGFSTTAWAHLTGCCDTALIWQSFENPLEWVTVIYLYLFVDLFKIP